jgi:FkbM family methyltransferase
VLRSLSNNLPHRKPELWRALPGALYRQLRLRSGTLPRFVTTRLPGDTEIEVDARDPMGQAIYLYGSYEYEVTQLVLDLITPRTVFFDVGANIGYYSLLAASRAKLVFAFEPMKPIFDRLAKNVKHNGLANVTILNAAVAERDGGVTIFVQPSSENTGLASLQASAGASAEQVPAVTLDTVVRDQRLAQLDLMKIDIEGAEIRAFEGGRELLSRTDAPDVIFESHPGSTAADWLRQRGYEIFGFKRHREYEAPNLFASKRELPAKISKRLQPAG